MRISPILFLLHCFLIVNTSGSDASDKSKFWFANPTPQELMRPMTMDGSFFVPLHTPYTVDAGHVQFEGTFDYSHSKYKWPSQTTTFESVVWVPRIRIGLWNSLELKVDAYHWDWRAKVEYPDSPDFKWVQRYRAWDNPTFYLKANVIGNDHGRFALAIEPYYSPDWDNRIAYYGLNLPMSFKVTDKTTLFCTPAFEYDDYIRGSSTFEGTLRLQHALWRNLEVYSQFYAHYDFDYSWWAGYAGIGASYQIWRNIRIQGGSDFRVHDGESDEVIVNTGIAVRF